MCGAVLKYFLNWPDYISYWVSCERVWDINFCNWIWACTWPCSLL